MWRKLFVPIVVVVMIQSCSPETQLRKSWSDPSLADMPAGSFSKVFVMVTPRKAENKKAAEDQLVSLLKAGQAVTSYTYLTAADTSQKEIAEKLIKAGFDGAITMRVKAVVQTKTKYNPSTTFDSFYYYGSPTGFGYNSGYVYSTTVSVDKNVKNETGNVVVDSPKDYIIETNIYSLKARKLLWSGVTASLGAKKIDPALTGIVATIKKELKKEGYLKD